MRNDMETLAMEYTLASAAEAAGIAKTTIFRAIKSGKLSARRLDDKTFRIDASELARVYPTVAVERDVATDRNVPQQEKQTKRPATTRVSETELAVMKAKLEAAEAALDRERETVDDLRRRLDTEQEERRSLQRQLMPPEKPREPDRSPELVEDLRKRLEDAEGRIAALTVPEKPQERPIEVVGSMTTPAKASRGFLSRLWSR